MGSNISIYLEPCFWWMQVQFSLISCEILHSVYQLWLLPAHCTLPAQWVREYCKVLTNIKVPVTRYILLLLELLSTKKIPKVPKCVINVDYLEGGHNQWKEPFYFTGTRGHILGVWFLKVIFQCYEHHKLNSIHFHCTGETAESNTFKNKTNNLDKLKTQFFAGLNATTFRKCFGWIKYLGTYCIL